MDARIRGLMSAYILLTSSFTVVLALVAAEKRHKWGLVTSLGATFIGSSRTRLPGRFRSCSVEKRSLAPRTVRPAHPARARPCVTFSGPQCD